MRYIADLHIHSRFSRATAKNLNFENLYIAARIKGICVVGTGDFTHPAWVEEIRQNLVPAEPGLFKLRQDLEDACEKQLNLGLMRPVRFLLSCEISNIYKKDGFTRKLHHLVYFSGIGDVERFNYRLSEIGNLKSDGRPILGLDSRNLLEIVLETADDGFLVPAHIWTPWFSLFGSKSGFNTIEQCFGDLSEHIFAVETGLSSDPPMNWRVSDLDGITLVSNSDAHSPAKLGREANIFTTDLSYPAILKALRSGDPDAFGGTLEFFPEEGKYHQDGHRKCGINFHPNQTLSNDCICPVCGKGLTLGVLYRVEQLASRSEGGKPESTHPYFSLIPLAEILSELLKVGPTSKKVAREYDRMIETLGPELDILLDMPLETICEAGFSLLSEAIGRMRESRVHVQSGFDGEYGRITIFTPEERDALIGQKCLFSIPASPPETLEKITEPPESAPQKPHGKTRPRPMDIPPEPMLCPDDILEGLNSEQARAVTHGIGPLIIVAGPGTGKTRTLTCRIAWLIRQQIASPENILAVTFTNKAAREMTERLQSLLGDDSSLNGNLLPMTATFHSLCFSLLREMDTEEHMIVDDLDRRELIAAAIDRADTAGRRTGIDAVMNRIVEAKQLILSPDDDLAFVAGDFDKVLFAGIYGAYQDLLSESRLYDYEDLITQVVSRIESDPELKTRLSDRFRHIFIDEYQDLNYAQYRLVQGLMSEDAGICVIGDPDQSIYGFRGADATYFKRFTDDFPGAETIRLERNYRSTQTILDAGVQVLGDHSIGLHPFRIYSDGHSNGRGIPHIGLLTASTEQGEAVAIGKTIEQMIGGTGFDFHDFGKKSGDNDRERSFSDFAVLYRTRSQGELIGEILEKAGIGCHLADKKNLFDEKWVRQSVSALKIMEGFGGHADLVRAAQSVMPQPDARDLESLKSWFSGKSGFSPADIMSDKGSVLIENLSETTHKALSRLLTELSNLAEHTVGRPVVEKLDRVIELLVDDPADRPGEDCIASLRFVAAQCGADPRLLPEMIALQTDPDFAGTGVEKVSLLTMHAAKGLEFPVVFVAGCEDGLIPFSRPFSTTNAEEERRLFYVAITRAEKELYLCRARRRTIFGKTTDRMPSPFLSDLDSRMTRSITDHTSPPGPNQVQLKLFN